MPRFHFVHSMCCVPEVLGACIVSRGLAEWIGSLDWGRFGKAGIYLSRDNYSPKQQSLNSIEDPEACNLKYARHEGESRNQVNFFSD